jgi:neutral trehalase
LACPNGESSSVTQPPILAWSVLNTLRKTRDRSWAQTCAPYLRRYLDWIRANRDKNNNHLPEWKIERQTTCRSGESGLDNSPRFDRHNLIDAVDFAGFLSNDYRCLSQIAAQVGDEETSCRCAGHARTIADAVNQIHWRQDEGFYFDRAFDGTWIPVKAVSGFTPLFAGIADRNQAEVLRKHLHNPTTFGAAFPIPSVSLDSGAFCKDMWRGPTWINFNYLIYSGLLEYGYYEEAEWLKEKILTIVEKWYLREGCLYEFYDAMDLTPPRDLDRKQRLASGQGIGPISDYHWTAAVVAALLLDQPDRKSLGISGKTGKGIFSYAKT